MRLTKRTLGLIHVALRVAIMSEEEFVYDYKTQWYKGRKVVPKDDRAMIRKSKARIRQWEKLKEEIGIEYYKD